MLVKINPTKKATGFVRTLSSVHYNLNKVNEGSADIIELKDIPSIEQIDDVFIRVERSTRGHAQETSFHMSLNPNPSQEADNLPEDKIVELVHDLMGGLGYERQPWIIFRHYDTDRVHYHIVSTRIGVDGLKISSRQDHRRARAVLRSLQSKYGYSITREEAEVRKEREEGKKKPFMPMIIKRFDPTKEVIRQIENLAVRATSWHFTTREQFYRLMQAFGVKPEEQQGRLTYAGLNARGQRCTGAVAAELTNAPNIAEIDALALRNKSVRKPYKGCKDNVANLSRYAYENAVSERHFVSMLHKVGIDAFILRSSDGKVFGITYIDHRKQCCWKASEVANSVTPAMLQSRYDKGEWQPFTLGREVENPGRLPRLSSYPPRRPHSPYSYSEQSLDQFIAQSNESVRSMESMIRAISGEGHHVGSEDDMIEYEYEQRKRMEEQGL